MNDRHLFRKIVYLCLIANLLCGCMGAQTGVVATPTIIPTETSTPIPSPTAKPSPTAQSKRALFVLFGQFEEHEYGIPRAILEEAGILVSIASSSLEEVTGSLGSKVQPIVLLSEVKVSD